MTVLDRFSLDGRRALVTGGSGGLGRAMAEAIQEAGATVAIIGRSEAAEVTARELGAIGVRADLGNRDELRAAFARVVAELGGLDILITAHGDVHAQPAVDHELDSWDRILEVNLTSVMTLCQLAGRIFLAQSRGKIVNVASMLSFSGGLNVVSYSASKGGVAQLTKALANEWASHGVNVNAIAPGYIQTNMNVHIWRDNPTRTQQVLDRLPADRWGTPSDLQGAIVFLTSPASDYVHGAIVPVDGGWLAR